MSGAADGNERSLGDCPRGTQPERNPRLGHRRTEAGSWTCPLQYQWGEQLGLYFSSLPDARHVRNIAVDQGVTVAIYSLPGPPDGNLGLQVTGLIERLTEETVQDGWIRFKITPTGLWYFDSRSGRERHEVNLATLDLGAQ